MSDTESQVSSPSQGADDGSGPDSGEGHSPAGVPAEPDRETPIHRQAEPAFGADPSRSGNSEVAGGNDSEPLPAGGNAVPGADEDGEGLRNRQFARLGELFGGFAHEIRNPLSTIGLNLQLVDEDLGGAGDSAELQRVRRRLGVVKKEVGRLQDTLEQFLGYVRLPALKIAALDLNDLLGDIVEFTVPEAGDRGVGLRCFGAPQLPTVCADADQIRAVVVNLLNNALEACADGDEIIVRTLAGGEGQVLVLVADTGPGMDAATRQRIFEPYFSTKRHGTGLGLPTARRTVEQHGGSLVVDSEPGRGTQFTIRLPVAGPPTAATRGVEDQP